MKNLKTLIMTTIATTILATTLLSTSVFARTIFDNKGATIKTTTATLSTTKISFNGQPAQNVQTYNVDGYNFVSIRSITDKLNMQISFDMGGLENTLPMFFITPDATAKDVTTSPTLTAQTITAKIVNGGLSYDGMTINTQCFNYAGHYYMKLADIQSASDENYNNKLGSHLSPKATKTTVTWDASTKTIQVDSKILSTAIATNNVVATPAPTKAPVVTPATTAKPVTVTPTKAPVVTPVATPKPVVTPVATPAPVVSSLTHAPQSAPTSAPAVGSIPAKILINPSLGAYDKDGKTPLWSNVTPYYAWFKGQVGAGENYYGQCTWYAQGRFMEVTGRDITVNNFGGSSIDTWISPNRNDITTTQVPTSQSIAAIHNGKHVTFVEYVEKDANGNPTFIYYTEGNYLSGAHKEGIYYPDYTGMVKKMAYSTWKNQGVLGYIIAK